MTMRPQGEPLKGQDVEIKVFLDGNMQDCIVDVNDFSWEDRTSVQELQYLGKKSPLFTDSYGGAHITFNGDTTKKSIFDLLKAIRERAAHIRPGLKFSAAATFNFPSGERKRIIFPNLSWDASTVNAASRVENVKLRFGASCSMPQDI